MHERNQPAVGGNVLYKKLSRVNALLIVDFSEKRARNIANTLPRPDTVFPSSFLPLAYPPRGETFENDEAEIATKLENGRSAR